MDFNNFPKKILRIIINKKKMINVIVKGNSMYPILSNNQEVLINKKNTYCIGDIVAFYYKKDNMYLIHRIVAKKRKFLYLKGDNAYRLEKIISKDIIGYITQSKNNNSFLKEYCQVAYKLGKYSKRVKYDMRKIHNNRFYIKCMAYLKLFS